MRLPCNQLQPTNQWLSQRAVMARDDNKAGTRAKGWRASKHAAQSLGGETRCFAGSMSEVFGEVRAAESAAVALRVRRIGQAGERDWRADSWFLERTQRDSFGSDGSKGGAVNVQINIERGGSETVLRQADIVD